MCMHQALGGRLRYFVQQERLLGKYSHLPACVTGLIPPVLHAIPAQAQQEKA